MPDPYNPLARINLARSVESTLLQQRCLELPLTEVFNGAGLYAIYYSGFFAAYAPISSTRCKVPIYVGKADPAGARKGLADQSLGVGPVLFNRIADHSGSIAAVRNLRLEDFRVRYLIVEDIFIGMAEQLLIQQFRPLWNVHVSGFGLHDPGRRRHGGNRSEWDELHPGRPWHQHMRPVTSGAAIRSKIAGSFASGDAATLSQAASSAPPTSEIEGPVPQPPEESN
jgi:hypothetical protein